MDKITIKGLEVFANHGVFPEENKLGQKFIIDAILYTDTRKAGANDDLSESIHYGEASVFITKFLQENTYQLLEAAAENLAHAMLIQIPLLQKVELEIKKPWAPIGLSVDYVSVAIARQWHRAYLSVGSNIGDKEGYIRDALAALDMTEECRIVRTSQLITTEPYGNVEQDDFLNGCVEVDTLLTAEELLVQLHYLEQEAGRERQVHWGPRTLDMDIIFYDKEIIETETLLVPHVDMENRYFVLKPMAEIAPNFRHPILQKTVKQMLLEVENQVEEF